jgi:radical SAM superfamily enzyme YgiQ (UPF0313 family)
MEPKNILLLNPPADKICIRDYFCSKTSRSGYLFPPVDLLMLSGWISKDYNVVVMDAIVEKINSSTAIERISKMNLKAIVSLVGAATWESDIDFLRRVNEVTSAPIICIGDVTLERPKNLLFEYEFLDAVLLDFTTEDLLQYLNGNLDKVKNMVIRDGVIPTEKELHRDKWASFTLPIPRHELFIDKDYRSPFVKQKKFTVVLTDFGCPFDCLFCVMPSLGYKYREVNNVLDELEYIHKLGIKEIFFMDQSFGAHKERSLSLCRKMLERKLNFGWTCFSRIDLLDRESLELMQKSGCHTIIIGVESGDEQILKIYKKSYDFEKMFEVFNLCRQMKIRTVGTFIIGFPEDTPESCLKTINLAKKINCDFASFHVAVPRGGTGLRGKAIQMHLIKDNLRSMDQSGSTIAMPTQKLNKDQILRFRKKAVREFYLRPKYLFNRFSSCSSLTEMLEQIREGMFLIRNN